MSGYFITGTDTGVGKTLITAALAGFWRRQGRRVGAMKPVETGVSEEGPFAEGSDARLLDQFSGSSQKPETVCPYRFSLPLAPSVAARQTNREIDIGRIEQAFQSMQGETDRQLVEGAGGILVPINEQVDTGQLVQRLGLPLLIVARAGLGTINHTGLTIHYARSLGIPIAGVILSGLTNDPSDPSLVSNDVEISQLFQVKVIDSVPQFSADMTSKEKIERLIDRWQQVTSVHAL